MGGWMVMAAAMGFSSNPILAQMLLNQGFTPDSVTLYRFAIPAVIMLLMLKKRPVIDREFLGFIAVGGLSAIGMLAFMFSLTRLAPSTVILTYYTYPMFAILIGWLCFGKKMSRNRMIAAMLIAIAVGIMQESSEFSASWQDLLICLIAPASFAIVINVFSLPERQHPANTRMFAALLGHMFILLPVSWLASEPFSLPETPEQIGLIFALGILSAAVPQFLFSRGAQLAGVEQTTMISSFEVVFALLLAWFFLGEAVSFYDGMAAMLILLAGLIRSEETPLAEEGLALSGSTQEAYLTRRAQESSS